MLRRSARMVAAFVAVTAVVAPHSVSAQESPPEEGEIGMGTAKATALVARVGPAVGDLELAIRAGLAVTQLTNRVAQSTGQSLDLGLIGTALTAEGCGDAIISADQLPQSTDIDNRDGVAHLVEDEGGIADAPLNIGRKDVAAGTDPVSSRATTTLTRLDLPGVINLSGGQAEAITEVLPGEGRQATATTELSLSIGPITLTGLAWRAVHRTGADPQASASFSIGSIEGLPFPVPLDDLDQVEDLINTTSELLGLGLTVDLPNVERFLEPTDFIRITPLRISLEDSPVGSALIAPFKVATQDVQDSLFTALTEAICQTSSALLVGDVALSVLAGSGSLALEFGGAEASSSRFEISNPFGAATPPLVPPTTEPPTWQPPAPGATASTETSPAPTPTAQQQDVAAAPPIAPTASGPMDNICTSIHPNGNSCADGAGVALGLLGILLAISAAGYEISRQRRDPADPS